MGARGSVVYNNSYNNVKSIRTETFNYQAGMNVQCYLPWGFEVYSDAVWNLRSGYGQNEGNDYLMWNAQLSKSFFKRKQLFLRFKIYDILQQENALTRTITATSIRDTESNVLGSYFIFHVIVRINKMGGKVKRK